MPKNLTCFSILISFPFIVSGDSILRFLLLVKKTAVDFAVDNFISTKVYDVPSKQNIIADYLSRFQNAKASQLALNMHIQQFQPPRNALGVVEK